MNRDERLDRVEQAIKDVLVELHALRAEDELRRGVHVVEIIPEGLHDSNADGFWDEPDTEEVAR